MSFVQFESAREKEKIREELRQAREELLKRAQQNAETRAERRAQKTLSGEVGWMLPSLEKKFDKHSKEKKQKKRKKEKKSKNKKSKKRKHSSSESNSSDTEAEICTKKKDKQKMNANSDSSSSSSSPADLLKETNEPPVIRDDWMTTPMLLKTFSKNNNKSVAQKQQIDAYEPGKSSRELNHHWKNGGTGLPAFRKPRDECDDSTNEKYTKRYDKPTDGWKKQSKCSANSIKKKDSSSSSSASETEELEKKRGPPDKSHNVSDFLTDQQMNELGAKIIKAEILENNELAEELKKKLECARAQRELTKSAHKKAFLQEKKSQTQNTEDEHILLTTTDNKGFSRPLLNRSENESDRYGDRRGRQKNKKAETHASGERVRYFPDDDKYDIKQMFEREKYTSAAESDAQFVKIAGKHKNPKDDLEDIFADKIRKNITDGGSAEKQEQRAINEHERLFKKLESCDKCFESQKMEKELIVSIGRSVYLALPWHEGLQPNHCLIVPMQHIGCSTQLDEDTWEEISDFRKALTRMFADHKQDVVFFETVRYQHKRPHMVIHCVPAPNLEMAPFYFKKAIEESEYEWSTNKQLVSLNDKSLRRAIPKGLPYFWVNFGMDSGFAHVIEDQERFPSNFAQEIIGGMLHLDAVKWRRPRKEPNIIPKVKNLADWWKLYDFTDQ